MNHVRSLPGGRQVGRPFNRQMPGGPGAPTRPRRRSVGVLRGAKFALFLFVAFYYFPLDVPGFGVYKIVGWALAMLTGIVLATGGARVSLSRYFMAPVLVLFMAGIAGSVTFGAIDVHAVSKMVQNLVLMMLIPILVDDPSDVVLVLKGIAFGGLLTAVSGFLGGVDEVTGRVTGILGNANGYGQICGQTTIVLIAFTLLARRRRTKVAVGLLMIPTIVGLILSGSRGAAIAFAAALVVYLVMRGSRGVAVLGAAVLGLVVLLAMPEQVSVRWQSTMNLNPDEGPGGIGMRAELARRGVDVWEEHPVAGTGFGNVREGMAEIGIGSGHVTHNVFTQAMGETGTIGLIAFCFLIGVTLYSFWTIPGHWAPPGPGQTPPPARAGGWAERRTRLPMMRGPSGAPWPGAGLPPARRAMPAGAGSPGGARAGVPMALRTSWSRLRTRSRLSAILLALMVVVMVGQLSSGNYVHPIWYILFGIGQSLFAWKVRVGLAARRAMRLSAARSAPNRPVRSRLVP